MAKTSSLKIRVTEDEHAILARRAMREGTTITNLVRSELGLTRGAFGSYADRVSARWPVARSA